MTAPSRDREMDFEPVYHHYGPHRAGLPPLIPYFRELWERRAFAAEMSKATMRGANSNTFFGQAWLILNPLLLAGMYYMLVTIIRRAHDPGLFAHLTSALFAFTHGRDVDHGRGAVGDRLRQAADQHRFPATVDPAVGGAYRILPVPADDPGLLRLPPAFLPRRSWHPRMLLSLYFLVTMVVFSMGLAAFFATLQVYFRDTSQLPAVLRPDVDVPVPGAVDARDAGQVARCCRCSSSQPAVPDARRLRRLMQDQAHPTAVDVDRRGRLGDRYAVVVGFLFFISREREFAVRLT